MSLIDLIKNILPSGYSREDRGFFVNADSTGLIFSLHRDEFASLKDETSSGKKKLQYVILSMLEEQKLARRLPNGFHLDSYTVCQLGREKEDEGVAELLGLPQDFPGCFLTYIEGQTTKSNFRVDLSARIDNETVPIKRKGPYLVLGSEESYRLTPAELFAIEALEQHKALSANDKNEAANLKLVAELQTAKSSGLRVDLSHFENLEVEVPEDISVTVIQMPNGDLSLHPNLGVGLLHEDLESRWGQLAPDADSGALRVKDKIILLDKKKVEGIREVWKNRRIPAEQVEEFLATPTAFLNASLVNLELGFSARVLGVGHFKHVDFGTDDAQKQNWFDTGKAAQPAAVLPELIKSEEDFASFIEQWKAAQKQGAEEVFFGGKGVDVSNPTLVEEELEKIKRTITNTKASSGRKNKEDRFEEPDETLSGKKLAVIIKEAESVKNQLLEKASNASMQREVNWGDYPRTPYNHQREGVNWLLQMLSTALNEDFKDPYRLQGALLADDMGLGKTYMSLIGCSEYYRAQREASRTEKPILMVGPLSLLENWEDEVGVTFNDSPFDDIVVLQSGRDLAKYRLKEVQRESKQVSKLSEDEVLDQGAIRYALKIGPKHTMHRLDQERRLVLTTYQTLRDYQFSLCSIDWGMVIFDEAQNIKNPNALQTRAAKGLKSDFKLLVTGTPVENSLGDFWCLLDTAQPGLLGDWPHFRDKWIRPILRAPEEKKDVERERIGRELREAVGRFMLRRIKEEELQGLPKKTLYSGIETKNPKVDRVFLPLIGKKMSGVQLAAYDAVLERYESEKYSNESEPMHALSTLHQLKELSLHPRLNDAVKSEIKDKKEAILILQESSKLKGLVNLLDQIKEQDEKVILFMVSKQLQMLLKLCLGTIYNLNIHIINGDTKAVSIREDGETRKQLIAGFEEQKGFNILIMSPVAAGVGLTVVGANHVVHVERHWNPAKELQASDRVYRIGQKKDVHIYMLSALHPELKSFDYHLDSLLNNKLVLKDAVVTTEDVTSSEILARL